MAITFYAFWNGAEVADLFHAVVGITGSGDYVMLLKCAALLGFLMAVAFCAVRYRGQDIIVWCAGFVLLTFTLYIPTTTVVVHDVRARTDQAVENVPLGLGWPAGVLSHISYWLTRQFETAFNDPDTTHFSEFGMALPQRTITALLAAGPVTSQGQESLSRFIEHCVVPEVLSSAVRRHEILTSTNLWKTVSGTGWVNPARHVLIDETMMRCPDAAGAIEQYLNSEEIPRMSAILAGKLELPENALQNGMLARVVPGAEEIMLGVSQSLTDTLKHTVMISSLPRAMSSFSAAQRSPMNVAIAISRSQGNLSSEINYRTIGLMAQDALPKLRNQLEFIVLAVFPLVIILVIAAGQGGVPILKAYFTLLISLSLWAPITAAMNYLTIHVDANPMNRLVAEYGGMTLQAVDLIREAGASSQAMASMLLWVVPLFAYAIAKGSDMAITSMANSILAPAASAAQAQGTSLAMGNLSAGNASVGNTAVNSHTGNHNDTSSTYTSQTQHVTTNAAGSATMDVGSNTVTSLRVNQSDIGVNMDQSRIRSTGRNDTFTENTASNITHGYNTSVGTSYSGAQSYSSSGMISREGATTQNQTSSQANGYQSYAGNSMAFGESNGFGSSGSAGDKVTSHTALQVSASSNFGDATAGVFSPKGSQQNSPSPVIPPSNSAARDATVENSAQVVNPGSQSNLLTMAPPLNTGIPMQSFAASGANQEKRLTDKQNYLSINRGAGGNFGFSTEISGIHTEHTDTNTNVSFKDDSGYKNTYATSDSDTFGVSQSRKDATSETSGFNQNRGHNSSGNENFVYSGNDSKARAQMDFANFSSSESASINGSIRAREMALEQAHGSVTDALWNLNQSQESRRQLMFQGRDEFELPDNLGARGDGHQAQTLAKGRAHMQRVAQGINHAPMVQVNSQPARTGQMKVFSPAMPMTEVEQEKRLVHAGSIKAAQTYFKYEETGITGNIGRALLKGHLYNSPDVLMNELQDKASSNPELANFLKRNAHNSNLTDKQYMEKLKELF